MDELGTKDGAVTKVEMNWKSSDMPMVIMITVKLNRPFVYAIIDNGTNLPIFVGTVINVK